MGTQKRSSKSMSNSKTKSRSSASITSLVSKSSKSSNIIPRYDINNKPSSSSLVLYLKKDQTIVDRYGFMNYVDSSIKLDVKMVKGVMAKLKFIQGGSEDSFENFYTGTHTTESPICFAPNITGDILPIEIKAGESYVFDKDNILCYTPNIKFETTYRFRNIIGGGDVMLKKALLADNTHANGMIWLFSNGSIQTLPVAEGQTIKVETGLFMTANTKFNYTIAKLGGLKTMLFSDENILYMEFKGPGVVYLHSRNRKRELQEIIKAIKTTK